MFRECSLSFCCGQGNELRTSGRVADGMELSVMWQMGSKRQRVGQQKCKIFQEHGGNLACPRVVEKSLGRHNKPFWAANFCTHVNVCIDQQAGVKRGSLSQGHYRGSVGMGRGRQAGSVVERLNWGGQSPPASGLSCLWALHGSATG